MKFSNLWGRFKGVAQSTDIVSSESTKPQEGQVMTAAPLAWQQTNSYQYLLNTATLSYQANSGKITIELTDTKQAAQWIDKIIRDTESDPDALAARVIDAGGAPSPFVVTACAVVIEQLGQQTRIRAIPEAATLRVMDLSGQIGSDVTTGIYVLMLCAIAVPRQMFCQLMAIVYTLMALISCIRIYFSAT